jgi:DNA-binding transcriptional regulator LsrR (DeoR family)
VEDRALDLAPESLAAMHAAASLYYEQELSQQEVAERLDVSRSTVSRLLQLARTQGIVRIEVRPPSPAAELAIDVAEALGLRRAAVVPALASGDGLQALVAPTLAELEALALGPGDVLAISWGRTIWEVAQAHHFPDLRGVRLVPAIGGMDELDVRFQSNEIVRRVAGVSGAEVSFLHVPAFPSPELRSSLLSDPDITARLELWDGLDAALVGIGMPPSELGAAPVHVTAERDALTAAVGDVASRHFDLAGDPVEMPQEARLLGVSRAQLRAAGTVIGVAAGAPKVRAVVGAARGKLIDVLVTDARTASAVLELVKADT